MESEHKNDINYIKPIVDYKTQRKLSVDMYRDVL